MTEYELGILTIQGHNVEKLTDALGISENHFEILVETAQNAWEYGDTVSESIEFIAKNLNGSELVLAMVLLGRFWEKSKSE